MLHNRNVKPKTIKLTVYKNLRVFPFNQGAGVQIYGSFVPVNFSI